MADLRDVADRGAHYTAVLALVMRGTTKPIIAEGAGTAR